jgi:hypothetical protein
MPQHEDDPCIAHLPGIRYACCGHGTGDGYLYFENGIVVRFPANMIERALGEGPHAKPESERFWED